MQMYLVQLLRTHTHTRKDARSRILLRWLVNKKLEECGRRRSCLLLQ